ncbi:Uncharacterized protein MCHI_000776 [Candidatus Magnetoovum chiemensis]|nr:Uncharacterized protein MCHI_000776 [Candidatus Magnetoovum chiemensis]
MPLTTELDNLYNITNGLSSMINCGDCTICEGESVYLLPQEVESYKDRYGCAIASIESVYYLQHKKGNCPFFDIVEGCFNCSIYNDRPFCCRLYPLGIFDDNGTAKWGIYKHCPKHKNIPTIMYSLLASALEKELGHNACSYLHREDRVGVLAEGLKGEGRFKKGNGRFVYLQDVKILGG